MTEKLHVCKTDSITQEMKEMRAIALVYGKKNMSPRDGIYSISAFRRVHGGSNVG